MCVGIYHQIMQDLLSLRRKHEYLIDSTHNSAHNTKITSSVCTGKRCINIKNFKHACIYRKTCNTKRESSCMPFKQHYSQEHFNNIMSTSAQTHKTCIESCTGKCCTIGATFTRACMFLFNCVWCVSP